MTYRRRFENDRTAVTAARRFATETLAGRNGEIVDTAGLLVSELGSNCVRHTDSQFEITITDDASVIRIAATDWGGGEPVMRHADATALSGRGLAIIAMLSDSWGIDPLGPAGSGKVVWFTLAAAGA